MVAQIEIDGKKLTSIREASSEVAYSRDYITRLAREGKIIATNIGHQWYIDCESLKQYAAHARIEAQLRKTQLSEERKQEHIFRTEKERQEAAQLRKAALVKSKAVLMASFVLSFGLLSGVVGQSLFSNQLASVSGRGYTVDTFQSAALANTASPDVVLLEDTISDTPVKFSSQEVAVLAAEQNGILIIPSQTEFDPTEVFSDEVKIKTASSGQQSAVLVDTLGEQPEREIPFVLVPINAAQN